MTKPEKICASPTDAEKVKDALAVLADFKKSCEDEIEDFIQ